MSAMVHIFSWGERWNEDEIFHSTRIELGFASLNGTFHLSPNENICSIARMRKHYLFYITCTKIQFLYKFNRKNIEKWFQLKQNIFQAARPTLCGKYYADACVMLNARTAPVAFSPSRVSHVVFLISLVLEQTSIDCIGNTEHSYIKVKNECSSK